MILSSSLDRLCQESRRGILTGRANRTRQRVECGRGSRRHKTLTGAEASAVRTKFHVVLSTEKQRHVDYDRG